MAKTLSPRLGVWCGESNDKLFLYQKGTFISLFFVASFYWHKRTCANTSISSALRKIIISNQVTLQYKKFHISQIRGKKKWEGRGTLLLHPLCLRGLQRLHLGLEELAAATFCSRRQGYFSLPFRQQRKRVFFLPHFIMRGPRMGISTQPYQWEPCSWFGTAKRVVSPAPRRQTTLTAKALSRTTAGHKVSLPRIQGGAQKDPVRSLEMPSFLSLEIHVHSQVLPHKRGP